MNTQTTDIFGKVKALPVFFFSVFLLFENHQIPDEI